MNRINLLFQEKGANILSVYYPAGFPCLEDTVLILKQLQEKGIDMVEIGIPFSDPMADGVVIQEASHRALMNGISLKKIFDQLNGIRSSIHIPVVLMGYLNPIIQYGFERFCQSCQQAGIDGVIIPDLPFAEYLNRYKVIADKYDIRIIMLITPETSDERIRLIDKHTDGFIYMVSSASTTGVQQTFDTKKQDYFRRVNDMNLKNPRLIGFGISNHETFLAANSNANGVIVGSRFVQLLCECKTTESAVCELLKSLFE